MTPNILQKIFKLKAKNIKIGHKFIGYNYPLYFIAEAGVNHNGKLHLALKMVEKAKEIGADAIKFQTFKTEQLCLVSSPPPSYQRRGNISCQSQLLQKLELKERDHVVLQKRAKQLKIDFLSTPHGHIQSARFLMKLKIPAFKIGSGDITNFPLLGFLAQQKKPIFLSTGTATLQEIQEAVKIIESYHAPLLILHCTTDYPTLNHEANLAALLDLYRNFPNHLIGFSNHTLKIEALLTATCYGASVIEAHFTLDKNLPGPDQKSSFEPNQLQDAISKIRDVEKILGSGFKKPSINELKIAPFVRKSISTLKKIKKGETFSQDNLTIRRPEKNGLKPRYWSIIIGKKAARNISPNVQLKKGDWR